MNLPAIDAMLLRNVYAAVVLQPEMLQLRGSFSPRPGGSPKVARNYYERVPERMYGVLASLFSDVSAAGRLQVNDPRMAAQHFAWLIVGIPLDRGMFLPPAEATGGMDVSDLASEAVRVFLTAYAATDLEE